MDEICKKLQDCKQCRFADDIINIWDEKTGNGKFGCYSYSDKATIMIVGQNPSHVRYPAPINHSMAGHQGDLFREIMGEENLILSNLIAISTPDNKVNAQDAIHGLVHLKEQIEFWKPKVLIALGAFCRDTIPNNLVSETIYLKHPDYYQTYRKEHLPLYRETIEDIAKTIKRC